MFFLNGRKKYDNEISAKEAAIIAEKNSTEFSQIMKLIKEAAHSGKKVTLIDNISPTDINKLLTLGYRVESLWCGSRQAYVFWDEVK